MSARNADPSDTRGGHPVGVRVFDPEADDAIALEAAYRVARVLALSTLRDASVQLDVPAVQDALEDIVRQVGEVQGMKSRLTSISNAAGAVSESLDDMRRGVIRAVTDIETKLQVITDASAEAQSA